MKLRTAVIMSGALLIASCAGGGDSVEEEKIVEGRTVFTETSNPPCSTCHTLQHAGATGSIGPNLDTLKPTADRVLAAVRDGVGIMPAQGDHLSPAQLDAVAYYVAAVSAGAQ